MNTQHLVIAAALVIVAHSANAARVDLLSQDAIIVKRVTAGNTRIGKDSLHVPARKSGPGQMSRSVALDKQGRSFVDVDVAKSTAQTILDGYAGSNNMVPKAALISPIVMRDPQSNDLAYVVVVVHCSRWYDNTYGWSVVHLCPIKYVGGRWGKGTWDDLSAFGKYLDQTQGATVGVTYPADWKWKTTFEDEFATRFEKALDQ